MKKNFLQSLILSIIFSIFIGCSTTYKATNYDSNEEFYKDFNNSAQNKRLKITLNNDSIIVVLEGAEIKNDSVIINYPDYYPLKLKKNLPLNEINQASYTNHWKGIVPGVVSYLFIGPAIGVTGLVFNYKTGGNHPETDYGANILLGSLSGIFVGTIVGLIVGWNNIYQFNP